MIHQGDALEVLKTMESDSVDCIITSPPYWGLRDYGATGQLGLEKTPQEYVRNMAAVFQEAKRVLRSSGTVWLNIGDSYAAFRDSKSEPDTLRGESAATMVPTSNHRNPANLRAAGLKHKDLCGIPWRLAFALQDDGWYLRQDIIWHKPNPMPESVKDRCTKSHEYVFLLAKSERYFFDGQAIQEPATTTVIRHPYGWGKGDEPRTAIGLQRSGVHRKGRKQQDAEDEMGMEAAVVVDLPNRNKRSVWAVPTRPFTGAHFATFPEALIEPMILAGCPKGGTVLDPFMGAGTTAVVAQKLGRKWVGIELNPEYIAIANERIRGTPVPML